MKTIKLTVTVEGGFSQLGIYYKLVKSGQESKLVKMKQSFEKTFTDLSGDYTLYVMGSNPNSDLAKTTVKLTYISEQIELDKDLSSDNPSIYKGKGIYTEYYFKA